MDELEARLAANNPSSCLSSPIYIYEGEWESMCVALEAMKTNGYVPKRIREYLRYLIVRAEGADRYPQLIACLSQPMRGDDAQQAMAPEIVEQICAICYKWGPVAVELGKQAANPVRLKNGSLHPAFQAAFADVHLSLTTNWARTSFAILARGAEGGEATFFHDLEQYDSNYAAYANFSYTSAKVTYKDE
jgi:hypothetical protein